MKFLAIAIYSSLYYFKQQSLSRKEGVAPSDLLAIYIYIHTQV